MKSSCGWTRIACVLALVTGGIACTRAPGPGVIAPPASSARPAAAATPQARAGDALEKLAAKNYYNVHDVKAGDALNVRREPTASGAMVGVLPPGHRALLWTGTSTENGGSTWWRIAAPGIAGWVNAAFLAPASPPGDKRPKLVCFGNEPFWGLTIFPDGTTECSASCEGPTGLTTTLEAQTEDRWNLTVTTAAGAGFLAGTVAKVQTCSDGMSDFRHLWAASLRLEAGGAFEGCCRIEL